MRISDWSSDVCSSDLCEATGGAWPLPLIARSVRGIDDLPACRMICAATEQMGRSMENLEGLPVFVRAVREGSFSSAARVLGLTPSAVSKQIGRLEDQLAVRLFNRTTRRLSLTEEGAAFYERASRILADLEDAAAAVSSLRGVARGRLRVTMPTAYGVIHLLPKLPEFLARHPEVTLETDLNDRIVRSEEHTSELQSLMRI